MNRILVPLVVLGLLCGGLCAQPISGVVTPAIANPGQQVTLTITAVQNVVLPNPCVFQEVLVGSPTGPSIIQLLCIQIIVPLSAGSTMSANFSTSQPGTYWFRCMVSGFPDQYFCFEVRSPATIAPTLSATTTARLGQNLVMTVAAPGMPGAAYIAAASLTSNTGITVGGTTLCLDPDPVFALSFPTPNPLLFTNFQGITDPIGQAPGLTVQIPFLPALLWMPLKVQAAVLDPVGNPTFTNGLSFTIQP